MASAQAGHVPGLQASPTPVFRIATVLVVHKFDINVGFQFQRRPVMALLEIQRRFVIGKEPYRGTADEVEADGTVERCVQLWWASLLVTERT